MQYQGMLLVVRSSPLEGDCGDSKDAVKPWQVKDAARARRIMNGSSGSVRIVGPLAFTLSHLRCVRLRIGWDFLLRNQSQAAMLHEHLSI